MKQIGEQMETLGYWDILEGYTELRDTLRAPIDAEFKKYGNLADIKDKKEQQVAKDIVKVWQAIKPIKYPGIQPGAAWEFQQPTEKFVKEQQKFGGVWDMTYADFKKNFTPTMQSVMKDYFEKGKDLPDAMIEQLEYLAERNDVDVYTLIELMRATY
jgi:hypothetical protein